MTASDDGEPGGTTNSAPSISGRTLPTSRMEAFSDGVFAIAITLLVLELDVPTVSSSLSHALIAEWPSFLGYLVSFLFIGGVWVAHSRLTKLLLAADQVLVGLNLLLLLLVSFLPFTTKLMATHLQDSGERLAVVVFGVNLFLASAMVNVILAHAARVPDLISAADAPELAAFARQRRVALTIQFIATGLGLLLPALAVLTYLVISLLILIDPVWRAAHLRRRVRRLRT